MTAVLIQLVDMNNRLFLMANTKKNAPIPKPIQIRRPWQGDKRKATASEVKELMGGAPTLKEGWVASEVQKESIGH